jgi:hypothetical protein
MANHRTFVLYPSTTIAGAGRFGQPENGTDSTKHFGGARRL